MLKPVLAAVAALFAAGELSAAFADADALLRPGRRLDDLTYGLHEICLPAQARSQSVDQFIAENDASLKVKKSRLGNTSQTEAWLVGSKKYVSVMRRGANCTVSTSFAYDKRRKIMDDLKAMLAEGTSDIEVVVDAESDAKKSGRIAYCRPNADGQNNGYILDQWVQELDPPKGSRRRREVLFISISAPTRTFCNSG